MKKLNFMKPIIVILGFLFILNACGSKDEEEEAKPQAKADFTYVINGSTVAFSNTSLNATSYEWDFGDNTGTDTGTNPSHKYSKSGNYTITLKAISQYGQDYNNSTSKSITVVVNTPSAEFSMSATDIGFGESVTYTNASINATSYNWVFEGGTPSTSTEKNPVVTYNAGSSTTAKTYKATLTVKNAEGESSTINKNVNIRGRIQSGNFVQLRNVVFNKSIGYYRGSASTGIDLYTGSSSPYYFWITPTGSSNIYSIMNTDANSLYSWSSSSIGSGAPVRLYSTFQANKSHLFIIKKYSSGVYTIQCENGTYLTCGSTANGLLFQYNSSAVTSKEALWQFLDAGTVVDLF